MNRATGKLLNRNYICILINVVCMNLGFNMLSTIVTPYALTLGAALTMAGLAAGIMSITAMCVRPVTGLISDSIQPKKLLFVGSLATAVVIFSYSISSGIAVLLVLRVAHGILFGITTTATMAITRNCIPSQRLGEGMGYYGVAQAVASAIGPNLGLTLSNKMGYHAAFLTAAALTVAAAASSLLLEIKVDREKRPFAGWSTIRHNIIAVEVLPFLLICFILGSIGGLDGSFLDLYGKQEGIPAVGWYFSLQALVLVGSKFLLGKVSDRLPFSIVLFTGSALIGGAFVMLAMLNGACGTFLLALAAISRAVGVGLLQPAVQAACFKAVAPERSGAASATYMLEMDLGVGSAPVIGALLQKHVGFSGMYLSYLIPLTLAAVTYATYSYRCKGARS